MPVQRKESNGARWMEQRVEELRNALNRLMKKQIDSMERQTYGVGGSETLLQQEARRKRIRELSADYLAALRKMGGL